MEAQITNRDVITGRFIPQQNVYDLSGEYGIGYTLKGEEFYFDLEDYDKIKDYCWHINKKYVCTKYKNNRIMFLCKTRADEDDKCIVYQFDGAYNVWREIGLCTPSHVDSRAK